MCNKSNKKNDFFCLIVFAYQNKIVFLPPNNEDMEPEKKIEQKRGRGGYRENSGRKSYFPNKSITFGVRFSPEIWEKLGKIAQKLKISKGDALGVAVDAYELGETSEG